MEGGIDMHATHDLPAAACVLDLFIDDETRVVHEDVETPELRDRILHDMET